MTKLEKIKEVIYEVCEDLVEYHPGDRLKTTPAYHTIHLEHVLMAMCEYGIAMTTTGDVLFKKEFEFQKWIYQPINYDLTKSFENQRKEVHDFLYQLLVK